MIYLVMFVEDCFHSAFGAHMSVVDVSIKPLLVFIPINVILWIHLCNIVIEEEHTNLKFIVKSEAERIIFSSLNAFVSIKQ